MLFRSVPQENMLLPLASEVTGLMEYFYSFINADPVPPVEEKLEINLDIRLTSVEHNLVSGLTSFTHYVITWNTPYDGAIYTIGFYDPDNYSGWAHPIKTVFHGREAVATIGVVTVERGDQIHTLDDGIAVGTKVFYVVAMLPDGTFYLSNKLSVQF